MDSSDSRTSLLGANKQTTTDDSEAPLYFQSRPSPTSRLMHLAFVCIVVVMVLITFILSIYRSATVHSSSGLYFVLGLSLLGLVLVEVILVQFVRKGDLPPEKNWFLYLVGGCILLEAIFTNILLFL